ncbi:hypothetical protein [Poriferisphaera corsica]|nr:hypothetical protein [Poriferisphaera corsica]
MKRYLFAILIGLLFVSSNAFGQLDTVDLSVQASDIGLGGIVRPGTWTPVRLNLVSNAAEPRAVICQLRMRDDGGDVVLMQREVTLQAQVQQSMWLYGKPVMTFNRNDTFQIEVLDKESGVMLARVEEKPQKVLYERSSAIGVMGAGGSMGLNAYMGESSNESWGLGNDKPYFTQHEYFLQVRDLSFDRLPDRWYGLSLLNTMIWNPNGGSPSGSRVNDAMLQAVREWVERGGHLVVMLPPVGQQWTSSGLADLLPVDKTRMRLITAKPPQNIVGRPPVGRVASEIQMLALDVDQRDPLVSVIGRDVNGNALIVSKRYGFGTVTVFGIDMNSASLRQMGLPGRELYPIWNRIFGWQSPTYRNAFVKEEVKAGRITSSYTGNDLTDFWGSMITMKNTTGPALLLALLVFAVYWLVAGPISFFVLKARKKHKYSWVVFSGLVLIFVGIAWGGAYMIRPTDASITHLTLLDMDSVTGKSRVKSWMSVYMPTFGNVELDVAPDMGVADNRELLSSPGVSSDKLRSRFLDPQNYDVRSSGPHRAVVPFRSTTKMLEADFYGELSEEQSGLKDIWPTPTANLRLDDRGWPIGELKNTLPFALRDVAFVYSKGNGREFWFWRLQKTDKKWFSGETLKFEKREKGAQPLIMPIARYDKRILRQEGYLGKLSVKHAGRGLGLGGFQGGGISEPGKVEVTERLEMLSFYAMLPTPDFRVQNNKDANYFSRALGREFDISDWTKQRGLIVIGYMDDGSLPLPLSVDGTMLPSKGTTVVRWWLPIVK